jgi:hypothetical protein
LIQKQWLSSFGETLNLLRCCHYTTSVLEDRSNAQSTITSRRCASPVKAI